nr:DUF58 domain-containing protein [Falsirhodobacter halotolerans]
MAQALPPLLAAAERLAQTVRLGGHGRRQAGAGDEFWQYRPAGSGDAARMIDWRRSARSDGHVVRDREWQGAQSVTLWVDAGRSMTFTGDPARGSKGDRAGLLALALAVLLLRGGERVALDGAAPRAGRGHAVALAAGLAGRAAQDHAVPDFGVLPAHGQAVMLSDFLGPLDGVTAALDRAVAQDVRGALVQVLDPVEDAFPYDGRTLFESVSGHLRFETREAGALRDRYLDRLAERRAELEVMARAAGWHLHAHHTGDAPQPALLWLYRAIGRDM